MKKIYLLLYNCKKSCGLLIASLLCLAIISEKGLGQTSIYNYNGTTGANGSTQSYTVPAGVTSVFVQIWGAGGAGYNTGGSGGSAAFLKGNLSVTPGQVLTLIVGGRGVFNSSSGTASGGFGGGGASVGSARGASGGGASGIFSSTTLTQANMLAIAGGGAAGGYFSTATYGGGGGATTGSNGGNVNASNTGGGGATATAFGSGGVQGGGFANGSAGSALAGGAGGTGYGNGGGGGGGGYFGGGGGYGASSGSGYYSSGGGGGSSNYTASLTTVTNTAGTTDNTGAGTQAPGSSEIGYVAGIGNGGTYSGGTPGGNGLILITPVPTITSLAGSPQCIGGNITINGTGLTGAIAANVKINGVAVASITSNTGTQIQAVIAAGTTSGVVIVTTAGGTASSSPTTFTVNPLPVAAGTITGTATVCQGQNSVAYSVPAITNATGYVWTLPTGATIATGSNTNSITVNYSATATSGNITVYGTNACGNGTVSANYAVTVNPLPVAAGTITGIATVCQGQNAVAYSVPAITNATGYVWTLPTGATIATGSNTRSITVNYSTTATSGNITVYGTNSCGNGTVSANYAVTVNSLPVAAGTITGTATVCQGQNAVAYSVPAITNATGYVWTLPTGATIATGSNTNNITVNYSTTATSGNITVYGTNSCGNGTVSANYAVTVNPLPVAAGTITGTATVCQGQNAVAYSVPAITNATGYVWTLPTGATIATGSNTNSITVNYSTTATSGNITVYGTNSCGNGTVSANYAITVNPLPVAAGTITGTATVCQGQNAVTYTVPAITNATSYIWTYSGTGAPITGTGNSVTISYSATATSGNLTVAGTNSCGNGTISANYAITVNPLPVAAGTITGTATVCQGQNAVAYSVPAITNATGYVWTLPTGATIATGSNTNSITVNYSTTATSGNITVYGTNSCGNGTVSANYAITVNPLPVAAGTITGTATVCQGQNTITYTVPAITNATSYIWTYSGTGATITGTGNSITISYSATATSGNLTVAGTNSCGNGTIAANYAITVNQPPFITSNPNPATSTICTNGSINYTVSATGSNLTYQWLFNGNPISNGGDFSGATTATLQITGADPTDGGNYSVVVSGSSPCTSVTSTPVSLTVNQNIVFTTQPAPNTALCPGQTFTISAIVTGTVNTYQWYKNGSPFAPGTFDGVNTYTLTIPTVSAADAGSYKLFVDDGTGTGCPSAFSGIAVLTINPTPNAVATPASQTICSGTAITTIALSSSTTGTTYTWTRDNTGPVTGIAASGSGNITGSLTNTTAAPVTVTFTITPTANGCAGTVTTATVLVNPTPNAVATPASQTICSGTAITTIALSSSTTGTTYTWTRDNTGPVTGIAASGSGNITGSLTNTTAAPVTVTFTIIPTANGCAGTPTTATVLVNPSAVTTRTPSSQTICSGSTITTIALTSTTTGATFTWTRDNTGTVTGIAASGSGNISGSLTNTTAAPVTVTFTITVSANGCTGVSSTATVLVNPTPNAVATPASQTICSGTTITTIALSSSTTGTTYTWTRDNTGPVTGIAASGSGNITGSLTNTTAAPVTVTFTITPTANGCVGTPTTATVLVNPTANAVATPASQTICSGTAITTIALSSTTTGTTYAWTRNNTGPVTGIAASGSGNITGSLTNTTAAPVTVTFTITPTANGCAGTVTTATVLVNPTPNAVATPASQTICSGTAITTIALSSSTTGTTYTWTRDNTGPVTGIAASGSGNITGSLTNTTAAPVTVTFTITPTANGCAGTVTTATVLVNPTPNAVATPASQTICSGTAITTIALSSSTTGTTYTWTRDNTGPVTGIAASGSGNITGSLTNTTAAPVTVTFTIIPTANGCAGTPTTATVLVNPSAVTTRTPSSQTICSGSTITTIALTSTTTGATFTWTRDNTGTVTGIAASGSGNISGSLTNTTAAPVTVTFTITVSANGCTGVSSTATVLVNPTPNAVATPASQTICSGTTITTIALSSSTTGTTYTWTRDNTGPVTGIAASGSGNITGSLTNTTAAPVTVTFTITPTANGCVGTPTTATVLVNPTANAVATPASQTVCSGIAISSITLSGSNVTGTTYAWTRNNTGPVTGIAASGSGNITGSLTNTTAAPVTVTFTITPTANGCAGTVTTATVLVNPTPNAVATPASQTICSGTAITTIALSSSTTGTTYTWTRDNTGPVTGIAASGSGNITGSLTNTTAAPVTVTFTITPTANGCAGTVTTATVLVNPTPNAVATPASQTICSGTAITTIALSSSTTGTTYTWTRDNTGPVTGIAASGSGNITGSLTNTTAAPVTVTFTIIPTANGCAGTPTTATVLVNPSAVTTRTPSSQTICSGSTITTIALTSTTTGATFTWTRDNTGTVTGIAASGSGNISGSLTNTTAAPVTVTFTITVSANGCTGVSSTATVLVNPTPNAVATPASQTICSGTTITTIALSSSTTGTTYTWTRDNTGPVTGIAASGSGNITGSLTNTTAAPVTVTFTITPTANGCVGTPTTATVLVNPTANAVATPASQTVCSGIAISSITLSGSNVTGTTYAWTRNNTGPVTGIAASGSGNITGSLTNTTAAPVTVTFTITPTANGCAGTTTTATVLVNPLPIVASITDGATNICVNSITQFTDATAGGSWSITNVTGTATINTSGTVTGISAGTVTVVYTYSNGTCTNTATAPLTIDAQPSISPVAGGATSVCVSGQTPPFTDATSGGTWSIINGSGSATITSGGVVTGISAGTVTVLYTTNNLSCTNQAGVSLTVIAAPAVSPIAGGVSRVCISSSTPAFTDATTGGTWSIVNGTGSATITTGGVVTPTTAGTVTVTYMISNGTCNNTATTSLTIDPIPTVAAIGGGAASVCLNGTTPAFTDATTGGTWSITNGTGTASITSGGIVTGLTQGTVTVVYTVSNATCSNTATASLRVNALPVAGAITGASSVCIGSTITLNSNATGAATLTYTWASSNTSFATVTNAGVVTGVAAGTPGITYTVSDGNGCTATSPNYAVTVNARPTATITSPNATVCNDGTNTINITGTVTANGPWTLTLNSGGSATGSGNGTFSISVTPTTFPTTTYTISSLSDANCTSTPADLNGSTVVTVNTPVSITSQPMDQSVCVTTAAFFFVHASGTGVTYTWYKGVPPGGTLVSNSANITGATTSTLHFNQAALSDTGYYYAIAAGLSPCAPVTSDTAHLKVSQTINITLQPVSQVVCTGSNVMFTVTATAGTDYLAYKWLKNGSTDADANISRSDSTTFIITGATAANAANYSVVITDTITGTVCATAYSSNASLTVNPIPTATISGTTTVCQGGTAPNITFTNPQALPVTVTYNINGSGTTTINIPASSSATTGAPTGTPGVFTYNLVSVAYQAAPACTNTITGSATVTVNPTPTASISGTTTVCQGGTAPNIIFTNPQPLPVTVTYNINGGGTTIVNVPASSTATVTAPTGTAGVFNYNLVSVAYQSAPGCSTPITGVATVTVNPTPTATISGTTSLCQGSAAPNITFTNPQALAVTITYNINGTGTTTINVAANSTATVTAPTGTAGSFAYNLVSVAYQSAPGCSTSITGSATVTVKPTPTVSATNSTQTVCSGTAITNIVITNPNSVAGTTFSWSRDNTTNLTGVTSGSGSPISGTITNITNAQQITNFTITASANGCSSSTMAVITVNPKPVMTSASTGEVCNHATITIPLTSTVASTYTWIATNNTNVTGESTTTQMTSTLSNTLNNTSPIPPYNSVSPAPGATPRQPVLYTVVPTSTAGCVGNPQTVTVTVNPHYSLSYYDVVTNPTSADSVQTITICDGNEVGGGNQNDLDLYEGDATGTTDLWQYSVGSPGPWTPVPGPHINNGQHDTLPDPPSVFSNQGTYYFRLLLDGCTSDTLSLIISSTLKDTAGTPNTTVCESGAPSPITLSGANVTGTANTTVGGTWSITGLSPTNGSNQGTLSNTGFITTASGLIPTIMYTPPADYAGVVVLTLTSDDPDGVNNPCIPLTATRTITITQAPIISNPSTMSTCSGSGTNITLASIIPSTYTWTVGTITGGITGATPTSGSGATINQVLTNPSSTVAGTVTYNVTPTPTSPAGCAAVTAPITVTVNPAPAPTVTKSPTTNICQGSTSILTATNTGGTLTGTLSGSNYNPQVISIYGVSTILDTITLPTLPTGTINASDITFSMDIDHTNTSNLTVTLISPSCGQSVIFNRAGGVVNLGGVYTFNSTSTTTFPGATTGTGASTTYNPGTYKASFAGITFPCTNASGVWVLQIVDNVNLNGGVLNSWSLTINTHGVYSSVFSGPASIGGITYSGATNTGASVVVTPPAGTNNYTVATTDPYGCTGTSAPIAVVVNPTLTLSGATTAAVCAGSPATINLTGLVANSVDSITYKIGSGPTQTAIVTATGTTGTFTTRVLTSADNGLSLVISTIAYQIAPNCSQSPGVSTTLVVNPTPTLSGAVQAVAVCPGSPATINLTGLVNNSTSTITYTINGGSVQTATGVVASGTTASFTTVPLTFTNNGQILQITGITITSATPGCTASFTTNVTLSVNTTPTLTSTLTPPAVCSGNTFGYTPTSSVTGTTYAWTRAAVAGISQPASSGTGGISEQLTNTTNSSINVTYVYTLTANGCSNIQNVVVSVSPSPTTSSVGLTQTGAACAGSGGNFTITGLTPNITATIYYTVNNGPLYSVTVTANASGTATFVSTNLALSNNGQIIKITGVSGTACIKSVTIVSLISVNPTPTLTGATQTAPVCAGSTAQINLTGLVASSTSTVTYTINGGATQTVTGVVATAGGTASFNSVALTGANNGQILQITGITITSATPSCTATFAQNVTLAISPTPTLTGATQAAPVCAGSTAQINLTGLVASSTSTVTYTINGGATQTVTGVVATAGGTASFNSIALTGANNGQTLQVTGITITSATPGCPAIFAQNVTLAVSPTPTLTGATQTAPVCAGSTAQINLTGLVASSTSTVTYTINGGATQTVTGVVATAGGTASFNSIALSAANNGQTLQITGITITSATPGCPATFAQNVTLAVSPIPTLTGATAAMVCPSGPATVNLTGLVPNSSNNTISYKINGVLEPAVTGINADASGNAAFNTVVLTPANNGQTLTITSINNGSCSSSFTQNIVLSVSGSYTWLGVDNNWFNPANWCGGVPTITSNVLIPIVGTNLYPILTTGNGYTNNITIQSGASVTVSTGGILTINAAITNSGTFNVSTGKIELNGTAAQTIAAATFTTNYIQDLVVSNTAGVNLTGPLNVTGSITYGVANGILNTNGNLTLKSSITQTAYLGDMTNHTINGDVTVERYIATGPTGGVNHGKSWQLLATPTQGQTIKQSWMEGATAVDGAGPYPNAANPNPGYGTMTTSDLSATVTNQPTPGFDAYTPTGGPSMKVYNGATNAYIGVTSTALPIYNAAGYFVFVRGDRSVYTSPGAATPTILRSKGTLFTPANPPPSSTVIINQFKSVGNPYAAPLDIRNITLGGGTQQFFYLWDPRLGGAYNYGAFQTLSFDGTNYTVTPGGGSYGAAGSVHNYIQSGQAFLVAAFGSVSNGTVSFSEASKAGSSFSGTIFARPGSGGTGRNASVQSTLSTLRTTLHNVNTDGSTGGIVDGVLSRFDDSYSNDVDGLDARKTANTGENLSIMTSGKLLSIESRHTIVQNDTIFLNITRERALPYQFSFDAQNLSGTVTSGFVEDTYLKTRTPLNLSGNTLVNFTVANIAGSYAADRFRIVFSPLKVLPVTFTSIKAYKSDKNINVEWKVDNERNIKQYEVEKSVNGRDFSMLEVVKPTANNGSAAVYVLPDTKPVTGYNYYRVRSIDMNGSISYSTVVNVLIDAIKQDININPNPITDGQIHLQFMNEPAGKYGIRLLNKLGQVIIQKQITREDGTSTEFIKWDFNLAHGMYQLEVTKPDGSLKDINVLY